MQPTHPRATDKGGNPVKLPVRHIVYTVVAEDGNRFRVNYPGQEGWAAKNDCVRLTDAMDYLQKVPDRLPL